jgi:hypothetical protein
MADYSKLQEPGDFNLSNVYLYSYRKGEGDSPYGLEIKSLIVELNIFESIYSKSLTGNIVLADGFDVVEDLPLTGLERLEFKLNTPNNVSNTDFDFTSKTGSPMYVYKIENRKRINQSAQTYVLHFCSKEMYYNEKVRVSQALDGPTDQIVRQLVRDETFLNSKKKFFVEPSTIINRFVFPNIRPYTAIDMMAEHSKSKKYKNAGYLFFENKQGLHFRSFESLLADTNKAKEPIEYFYVEAGSVRGGRENDSPVDSAMRRIRSYEIKNQFDTIYNMRTGAYASRLITSDLFNKTIKTYDYNYFEDYPEYFHTTTGKDGNKVDIGHTLPATPSDELGKGLEEYPTKLFNLCDNAKLHNDFTPPDLSVLVRQRQAQRMNFSSIKLNVEISGNTLIDAGDIINLEIPQVKAEPRGRDLFLTGNYLVSHIRHVVSIQNNTHTTHLEVVKDSLERNYPSSVKENTFVNREKDYKDNNYDIYKLDESNA